MVRLSSAAVLIGVSLTACAPEDADWLDGAGADGAGAQAPSLADDQAALMRFATAPPPSRRAADPGTWVDEHTAICEQPHGTSLVCDEPVLGRVRLAGSPSLSEFCGRAKPLTTQLSGDRLWVKWDWCPAGSIGGCRAQNLRRDKVMAKVTVNGCETVLRNYSWYWSNVGCASGRCAWTDADLSHCWGLGGGDPVTIKFY